MLMRAWPIISARTRRYLDVNTSAGTRYELAVYMVGSAGNRSVQVTRIMDLQVLLLAQPYGCVWI
eukprot:COSAG05_NODE_127_length_17241_cov_7.514817_7_plen_65_part_00